MKTPLNVSRGQPLDFAADDKSVSGIITNSKCDDARPVFALVTVETEAAIPEKAHLTIPDCSEAGACGSAIPKTRNSRVSVTLSVLCSCIDPSTIGK